MAVSPSSFVSRPPAAWSRDPAVMTAWLFRRYQDLFIDLSQIGHHAALGTADADLSPGWYFTTVQDLVLVTEYMTADVFRLLKFATLFRHNADRSNDLAFVFNVTVHYHSRDIRQTWMAVPGRASGVEESCEVSWDAVWQTVVLGRDALALRAL